MLPVLMVIHFVADFLLQSRDMGKKKSSEPKWLAGHLLIQFCAFAPFAGWKFALANCAVHGVIDWHIWRGYKYLVMQRVWGDPKRTEPWKSGPMFHTLVNEKGEWKFWEDHLFYSTIGFDQLLHCLTIIFLSGWLL